MKFTQSWLKDHLDYNHSLDELSARLTMLGLEVEDIKDPAAALDGFTIGEVLTAEQHPNADRLRLCKVSNGKDTLQVVCGAPNARAGIKVVLAQPGQVIPATGDVLKKGQVRGIESQAMMCSWRELGLGEDHTGIIEMPADTPVGKKLIEVLSCDPMIDVSITPNRPDCLGVRGIARDLAASGFGQLKQLPTPHVEATFPCPIGVKLEFDATAADACPLFVGRVIRNVKNVESPQWLKDRLTAIGLRPISALVDITNYFTYDLARPLHVFDANSVRGNELTVRLSRPGESLLALNGKTYELPEGVTVIADAEDVESLGGVMGGERSGCSPDTTAVFLEVALFDPIRTATTGRKLDVLSDARFRFERGVDPAFVTDAAQMATAMIIDLCGGEASELVVAGQDPHWQTTITLRLERTEALGGIQVSPERQEAILRDLGCFVSAVDDHHLSVQPPSWRGDLQAEHDLVEEIIRINGYDQLPAVPLPRDSQSRPILTPAQRRTGWVRRALAERGLLECITWSFLPHETAALFGGDNPALHLANPISADLDAMRPSVLPNLIAAAGRNSDRGFKDVGLFEIGPQFDGPEPGQQRAVAAVLRAGRTGPRHWDQAPRAVDVFDARADATAVLEAAGANPDSFQIVAKAPGWYHPGRSGSLMLGNKTIAYFGELHPSVLTALDVKAPVVGCEVFLEALPPLKQKATRAKAALKLLPLQSLERDFAFVLDDTVSADAVMRAVRNADKTLITQVRVFDRYAGPHVGENKVSLALSVTIQPQDHTLTDAEIETLSAAVVAAVSKATGGVLRN